MTNTNDDLKYKKIAIMVKEVSESLLGPQQTSRVIWQEGQGTPEYEKNPSLWIPKGSIGWDYQSATNWLYHGLPMWTAKRNKMGALWTRGSVNLFTCTIYHKS